MSTYEFTPSQIRDTATEFDAIAKQMDGVSSSIQLMPDFIYGLLCQPFATVMMTMMNQSQQNSVMGVSFAAKGMSGHLKLTAYAYDDFEEEAIRMCEEIVDMIGEGR